MDAATRNVSASAVSDLPVLLSTKTVADLFKTRPARIQRLVREKRLPFANVSLKERGMLFARDHVLAFLNGDTPLAKPKRGKQGRPIGSKNKPKADAPVVRNPETAGAEGVAE